MSRIRQATRNLRLAAAMLVVVALSGCAGSRIILGPNLAAASRQPGISCAPFARELAGIALHGEAYTWWSQAAGRYARSVQPATGAVLVLRRDDRLQSGHVAVVSWVLEPRRILVIQTNWMPDELTEDHLVVDVSPRNDWSEVRMWWPPTNAMGVHTYPAYGFILPSAPVSHAALRDDARRAAARARSASATN